MMEVSSFVIGNYGRKFYHIIYNPIGTTEGLVNLKDRNLVFKGELHWVLRVGDSKHGEQIFLQNFRTPEIIENKTNESANARKYYFIEQYLPLNEGMFFTKLCMNVFEKVLKLDKEISNFEFQQIIEEERGKLEDENTN